MKLIAMALLCIGLGFYLGEDNLAARTVYTQVDNGQIRELESRGGVIDLTGGMDYAYTLPAFDEDGREREVTFGTKRQLRDGAFLCLTVMPLRGVTDWSEVPYDELPQAVRGQYPDPGA